MHRLVPWDFPITPSMGRFSMRLTRPIALPNPIGAVSVTRSTVHHTYPEHAARPFGGKFVAKHFIAGLAVNDRHARNRAIGFADSFQCDLCRAFFSVRRLEHIKIEQGLIVSRMARRIAMDCRRMNRQRTMIWVRGTNEFHHLSPIVNLLPIVVWESLY